MKVFITFDTTKLYNQGLTESQILIYQHSKYEQYQAKHPDWEFIDLPIFSDNDKKKPFNKLFCDAKIMLAMSDCELVVLQKGWMHDRYCSFIFQVANQYNIPIQYEE